MTQASLDLEPTEQPVRLTSSALVGYGILFLAVFSGFVLGGQAASFAQIGLIYMPFLVLAVMAYLGLRYLPAKLMALLWVAILFGMGLLAAVSFALLAVAGTDILTDVGAMNPEIAGVLGGVFGFSVVALILACMGFIPQVRWGLSRVLPINPHSFVHTLALVTITGLTLVSFAPLLMLGEPPLLTESSLETLRDTGAGGNDGLLAQIYTLVWTLPVAVFVVGYGIRRNFGETLARLGLVWPTLRQIGIGVGLAFVLVVAMNVLDLAINTIWQTFDWPRTDAEAFGELLAFALTPLGAIVIGVTAGLGEEVGVRGVLQPRLGILLSNLFFTSLHAFQYNWDALLVVFLLGFVFGFLRKYTNTSTAAITHGLYNFIVIMMSIYGISLFQ
ncbi:MAG: CPBP family intramembrane metalloprotease [Caldilineaceae bacterium]|nr:CPBP family intramembrane metalloprotease [Caldilineaceae bacterium]